MPRGGRREDERLEDSPVYGSWRDQRGDRNRSRKKTRTRKKIFCFGKERRWVLQSVDPASRWLRRLPLPAGEGRRAGSGPAKVSAAGPDCAACSGRLAGRILKFRCGDGTTPSTDPRAPPHPSRSLTGSGSTTRGPGIRAQPTPLPSGRRAGAPRREVVCEAASRVAQSRAPRWPRAIRRARVQRGQSDGNHRAERSGAHDLTP